MLNQSQFMSIAQPMPVLSQSQQVMNNLNNQNSPMMMNQLINRSRMMMNQSQSDRRLNNRCGGYGYLPSSNQRSNNNRKVKRGIDKRNHNNWKELPVNIINGSYNPPTFKELQQQNRVKPKRYISKKNFKNHGGKSAPFAPRNTTSFLIRAKKAGGITSLVSPCPVTPAIHPTPVFSPSREVLIDMAKEEWGVDGYGSMEGLIRLRSPGKDEDGSGESDVDHDLSRFEMVCPNYGGSDNNSYWLENRVDDQDTHIAQLEEKNLMLKNRLLLMEREFDNLRTRVRCLEMHNQGLLEEVVENGSGNEEDSEFLENKNSVDNNIEDDDHVNGIAANVDSYVN